jgi:LSD1 subclass zinc finger protein
MAAPAAQAQDTAHNRFGCSGCGADLEYAPGTFSMKCPYCGNETQIPMEAREPPKEHAIGELTKLPPTVQSLGTSTKAIMCKQCGANSQIPADKVSTTCSFCGSGLIVPREATQNLLKPEGIIPFAFDRNAAHQKFVGWISKGFFRPKQLKKSASLENIRSTYVPYFTYDAQANSVWRGEAGTYYYTTETYMSGGQRHTRQVRHIRWTFKRGTHDQFYDDVLICASKGLSGGLVEKVEPFNTKSPAPYTDQMLAGSEAEEYSIDPRAGWQAAAGRILAREREACSKLLGGDTQRNLQVSTSLSGITFKHLLLPIYISSYQYKGKSWRFMINGQTGEVVGDRPVDWIKVLAVVGGIIVALIVIARLASG